MRNTVIVCCLVYFCVQIQLFAKSTQSISVEYRQDALDYSKEKEQYVRTRASIATDTTEVNVALVKSGNTKTQATWSFLNKGDYASIAGGHYFLHNAAGLLLGKPATYNPDPYSIRTYNSDSVITLCKSGSPQYALYGIVSSLYDEKKSANIRVNAGISYKECYVTARNAENRIYPYSIQGLLSHYKREGQYTEPVQVITYFSCAMVKPMEYMTLQGFYYSTSVYYNNARILLEGNLNSNTGIESFGGYSVYAQYKDRKVTLFLEYAVSQVMYKMESDFEKRYSNAYYYGGSVSDKYFRISSIVKKSDKNFYAPFSNTFGSSTPQDIYYYSVKLKPTKKVTCSWAYIDQNNLLPSAYYTEYPHKRIHYINIKYKSKGFSFQSDYRNACFYKDRQENMASRIQQAVVWGITKYSSLHFKYGIYQSDATAWYASSGFGLKIGELQNDIKAIYAHSNGEKIYIAMLPLPHTSIISETIATSSFFIVVRLRYSSSFCKLSVRFISQLQPYRQTSGEMSATAWF